MAIIPKGSEPVNIKKRMDTLFTKLDSAYPDKVIQGLQKDHKNWSETVREFSKALGYPDSESFLNAYGYTVQRREAGRPKANNYDDVIKELWKRYPNGMPFSKISEITAANPDLKGVLKTMQNNARELFGMSIKEYFSKIGLFRKSQLDDLIDQLKLRYRKGAQKPNTLMKLMEENQDLPMEQLAYIKEIYGTDAEPFLLVMGVIGTGYEKHEKAAPETTKQSTLRVDGNTEEERCEAYLKLLAQRYQDKTVLPASLRALAAENRDIPVNKLNKYIRSQGELKIERYYIRNRIMQGKNTDLQEYTYCMLSFEKTVRNVGSKQYAYLAGENDYLPGDMVVVEFGFFGCEIGEVKEVIRCLGIDAPWPVAGAKEILRKAQPEEIAAGQPTLTAEDNKTIRMHQAAKTAKASPKRDWADAFPEQGETNSDGMIAGFVLANQEKFCGKINVDLRQQSSSHFEKNWMPCEFRFRGLAVEVAKLKRYAKENNIHISWDGSVSEDIRELWVIAEEKTMELIEKFPALKATGLAEEWWRQEVYVMYSESGFDGITKMAFGGYFDRRHDGGDGRWEWEYDMMEDIKVRFEWMQTGGWEQVSYHYPFTVEWNKNTYTRERNGLIYTREPAAR